MIYGHSNKHTGPFLGELQRPDLALGAGRGMYGNNRAVYVAALRPVKLSDGFQNVTVLVGDLRENLVERFGSGADEFMDDRKVVACMDTLQFVIQIALDNYIEGLDIDIGFMAPVKVVAYGRDRHVRPADFSDMEDE